MVWLGENVLSAHGTDGNEGVHPLYCCVAKVLVEPCRELATLNISFCLRMDLTLVWMMPECCVMLRVKSITIGFLLVNTNFDSWISSTADVRDLRGDLLLPLFYDLHPLLLVLCVV